MPVPYALPPYFQAGALLNQLDGWPAGPSKGIKVTMRGLWPLNGTTAGIADIRAYR